MNDTPTTDAKWETLCCSGQSWYQIAEEMKLDCRQRERELTAVTEESDKYRGLLIRLYNDLFVHHKGEAVRDLKILFREENYN